MRGLSDKKLVKLAKSIGCNDDTVTELGVELKLPLISIQIYHKKNQGSTAGTLAMLIEWKRDVSPWEQVMKLKRALTGAKLTELAEIFFPSANVSLTSLDSNDSGVCFDDAVEMSGQNDRNSTVLRCRKCDRAVCNMRDVINTNISRCALGFRIDTIFGMVCLVQLHNTFWVPTKKPAGKVDIISLSTADLRECSKNDSPSSCYDCFPNEYMMDCKGCSEQIGWCNKPRKGSHLKPFFELCLQKVITETYIKDVTLEKVIEETVKVKTANQMKLLHERLAAVAIE